MLYPKMRKEYFDIKAQSYRTVKGTEEQTVQSDSQLKGFLDLETNTKGQVKYVFLTSPLIKETFEGVSLDATKWNLSESKYGTLTSGIADSDAPSPFYVAEINRCLECVAKNLNLGVQFVECNIKKFMNNSAFIFLLRYKDSRNNYGVRLVSKVDNPDITKIIFFENINNIRTTLAEGEIIDISGIYRRKRAFIRENAIEGKIMGFETFDVQKNTWVSHLLYKIETEKISSGSAGFANNGSLMRISNFSIETYKY